MALRSALLLMPLIVSLASAQDLVLPRLPSPDPAAYVSPRAVLDELELPAGEVHAQGGNVCYDTDGHLRLTLTVDFGERLSDDRARASWRAGWLAAADDFQPLVLREHGGRLKAEARASAEVQAKTADEERSFWATLYAASPVVVVALVAGAAAGWALSD